MANANKLNGFTPTGYLGGADWDGRGRVYAIAPAVTNAIYVGDPVKSVAGADTSFGLPCIDIGAAGAACVGVVLAIGKTARGLGPWVDQTSLNTILYRPSGAQTPFYYALVADDPNIVFEAQEQASGGAGTNFTYAAASKNANFGIGTPGLPPWVSAAYIDNGTAAATTSTYNLKLLGLKQSVDNALGAWQRWYCLINNHFYRTGVTGV